MCYYIQADLWPVSQEVKTSPSHGEGRSSILLRVTNHSYFYHIIFYVNRQTNNSLRNCVTVSTADSDSVCEGSNPSSAANEKPLKTLEIQALSGVRVFLRKRLKIDGDVIKYY